MQASNKMAQIMGHGICARPTKWDLEVARVTVMLLHGPMFTNGKNVKNIQSSFSLKSRSFPGKSFSCHKNTGAKQSLTCNMRNKFPTIHVFGYQAV